MQKSVKFNLVGEYREDGTTDVTLDNPDNIPNSLIAEALFNLHLWYVDKLNQEAEEVVGNDKITQQRYLVSRVKVDQEKLKQILKDKQ